MAALLFSCDVSTEANSEQDQTEATESASWNNPRRAWTINELREHVSEIPPSEAFAILSAPSKRPAEFRDENWLSSLRWGSHPNAEYYLELIARCAEHDFDATLKLILPDDDSTVPPSVIQSAYRGFGRAKGLEAIQSIRRKEIEMWQKADLFEDGSLIHHTLTIGDGQQAAAQGWAETNPSDALDWLWKCRDYSFESYISGITYGLPENTDWQKLLLKARSLGNIERIFNDTKSLSSWNADNDPAFLLALHTRWLESDPDAALTSMDHMAKEAVHYDIKLDAFCRWMDRDPMSCISWIHDAEESDQCDKGGLNRLISYSSRTHLSRVRAAVDELPKTKTKESAYAAIEERRERDQKHHQIYFDPDRKD